MEHTPNKISIYACGGAGINIVGSLPKISPDLAQLSAFAIDTSKSNLRDSKFGNDAVYLFEGVDGSGKVRAENHALISKNTKQLLQKFKPGVFNVVISSGGGGSGGVIAAAIVDELMSDGIPVACILIGSTNSQIEVENTEKALKTYELKAKKYDAPVVVHYLENSMTASRKMIDGSAHAALHALLMLYSGLNDEMDTADLRNWVKHAGAPEVFSLQFCPTPAAYAKAGNVISVATLALHDHNTALDPAPAYQTVGYVVNPDAAASLPEPLHFTISGNLIDECAKTLRGKKTENAKRLSSAVKRDSLVSSHDDVSDNDVVL